MNKKVLGLSVVALALVAIVVAPNISQAYRGDSSVKGPSYTTERHEAMEKAFDDKDFSSWQKLMEGRGRVTQVVNKDNFIKFSEIHKLIEEENTTEAQKIREELGLGMHNGFGKRGGHCNGFNQSH